MVSALGPTTGFNIVIPVYNGSGSDISAGDPVSHDIAASAMHTYRSATSDASVVGTASDEIAVPGKKTAAADDATFLGIALKDIKNGEIGPVVVYGVVEAQVYGTTGAGGQVTKGDKLSTKADGTLDDGGTANFIAIALEDGDTATAKKLVFVNSLTVAGFGGA
ncbi:MAG: hypothetical protein D6746_00570 [Bacteroidetes bacterium]|nr:MAG: hypothetical protein D6746_00570 [Bacteroidota bacterium]